MNERADSKELAQIIMENDNQSRKFYQYFQRTLSDPHLNNNFADEFSHFKLSRIIYPMHFEEKTDSSALQVADACAFILKRWCMGAPEAERFYLPLSECIVNKFKSDPQSAFEARAAEEPPS